MRRFNINLINKFSSYFQHPFVNGNIDPKPIRDLLLEYKAEVVEEEVVDDESEVTIFYLLHLKLKSQALSYVYIFIKIVIKFH